MDDDDFDGEIYDDCDDDEDYQDTYGIETLWDDSDSDDDEIEKRRRERSKSAVRGMSDHMVENLEL